MKAVAIVNPVCGRTRGSRLRAEALAELKRLFPGITVLETAMPGHAAELARGVSDADLVIAVGGDGTVREVGSGLVGTETPFAIVPAGSGNDFTKTAGIPSNVRQACHIARHCKPIKFDAVRLTPMLRPGTGHDSGWGHDPNPPGIWDRVPSPEPGGLCPEPTIFVNAAGFGFDAAVTAEASKSRHLQGLALYAAAVFRAVRDYACPKVRVRLEGKEWEQPVLMLAAANGRVYGGGMKIAPDAEPDDGLLDICVIEAVSRFTVYRRLPRFVAGTHTTLREVRMYRSPWLEVELVEDQEQLTEARHARLQLDGDLVPNETWRGFRLDVLPLALTVLAEKRTI